MIDRFRDDDLITALRRQVLVRCDEKLAAWIAKHCQRIEVKAGKMIIRQGEETCELYFILDGSVDILINGRRVNSRYAGEHVGEMAIAMNSRRTATVLTCEDCILAKVTRPEFLKLAKMFPAVWQSIADVLARRLHQRRNLIREPNRRPFVFIGSSSESRSVAEGVRTGLCDLNADLQVWCDPGTFQASQTFIEDLTQAASVADFAILVFGKDDVIISRRKRTSTPRDNVVFEAGLFIGGIGRERTLLLRPKRVKLKILSDLSGVTFLDYSISKGGIDVSAACNQIRERIAKCGVR
jgi:CRP/FNR family cyclic AMP-dependent transcriptional regulator